MNKMISKIGINNNTARLFSNTIYSPLFPGSELSVSAQESILQTTGKSQEGNAGRRKESGSARNSRRLFETNRNWKHQQQIIKKTMNTQRAAFLPPTFSLKEGPSQKYEWRKRNAAVSSIFFL